MPPAAVEKLVRDMSSAVKGARAGTPSKRDARSIVARVRKLPTAWFLALGGVLLGVAGYRMSPAAQRKVHEFALVFAGYVGDLRAAHASATMVALFKAADARKNDLVDQFRAGKLSKAQLVQKVVALVGTYPVPMQRAMLTHLAHQLSGVGASRALRTAYQAFEHAPQ